MIFFVAGGVSMEEEDIIPEIFLTQFTKFVYVPMENCFSFYQILRVLQQKKFANKL